MFVHAKGRSSVTSLHTTTSSPVLSSDAVRLAQRDNPVLKYGFALLASGVAWLLTHWTRPLLGTDLLEFFHAAFVLSAWYGGLGPGFLSATFCFFTIDYFFIPPANQFVLGPHLLRLFAFGGVALLTSSLSGKLRNANSDLERS
jgi:K+-sensing histidine kinase KdpD